MNTILFIVSTILIILGICILIASKKIKKPISYRHGMKSKDSFFHNNTKKLSKKESENIRLKVGLVILITGLILFVVSVIK